MTADHDQHPSGGAPGGSGAGLPSLRAVLARAQSRSLRKGLLSGGVWSLLGGLGVFCILEAAARFDAVTMSRWAPADAQLLDHTAKGAVVFGCALALIAFVTWLRTP